MGVSALVRGPVVDDSALILIRLVLITGKSFTGKFVIFFFTVTGKNVTGYR
jgi:hypothetical protein